MGKFNQKHLLFIYYHISFPIPKTQEIIFHKCEKLTKLKYNNNKMNTRKKTLNALDKFHIWYIKYVCFCFFLYIQLQL